MNNRFLSITMVLLLGFSSLTAEAARRMGSGKSMGQQSNNVSQTQGTKPAQNATPASPANSAAAAPQRRPWGAMLGGLAAGLGLAWLASSLGFGEEFGQIIMFGLIAMAIMMAVGYFMRRKAAANMGSPNGSLAYQGASTSYPAQQPTTMFKAQPNTQALHTSSMIGSAVSGFQPNWSIPAGFDVDGFLAQAKANFVTMQDAWDRSDTSSLRQMMTDSMLNEIKAQIAERDAASSVGQMSMTEVVSLEAKLLGIEESQDGYLASIEFTGMIREEPNALPESFKEIWNMSRSKHDNSGWLLAGIQGF
ncbi:MAG: Tim44 domain-containing protein [Burkholderiales bacterium]|jgi:predicted lipid-binding transport protein (Tim44 family)